MLDFLFGRRRTAPPPPRLAHMNESPWQRQRKQALAELEPHEEPPLPRPTLPPPAPVVLEPAPSIPAIAKLIKGVTYGELMEMAEGLHSLFSGATPAEIAGCLHKWSTTLPEATKG